MADGHWENLKEIFHAAIALAPNQRVAYLEQACGGDASLRAAVESLLRSHEETSNFVDVPAYQAAAEMLVEGLELKPGQTIAHYKLLALLGEGGMGTTNFKSENLITEMIARIGFLYYCLADQNVFRHELAA